MLTWADVLKLAVPVVASLALLVIKQWYERRGERLAKQESLWRGIDQESAYLGPTLDAIDDVARAFNGGLISLVQIDIPKALTEQAARLAELHSQRSYVYSAYVSDAELVRNGLAFYRDLIRSHVCAAEQNQGFIAHALAAQAFALKGDFVKLARSELAVLGAIREQDQRRDQQVLARVAANISMHEPKCKERVALCPLKAVPGGNPKTELGTPIAG